MTDDSFELDLGFTIDTADRRIAVTFKASKYAKADAWDALRRMGANGFYIVVGEDSRPCVVKDHDWRRNHDQSRGIWRWYAVAAEAENGPDTWVAYDGTVRSGFKLADWESR